MKRERFTTPVGELVFPAFIDEPDYEYDEAGTFVARIRFPKDHPGALELKARLEALFDQHVEEMRVQTGKGDKLKIATEQIPWLEEIDRETNEPTGHIVFRTKLKHKCKNKKTGSEWEQSPKVFSPHSGEPLTDKPRIGPGSKVQISLTVNLWYNNALGACVTLWCEAIMLHELVEKGGGQNAEDFGFVVSGGDNPFADSDSGSGDY